MRWLLPLLLAVPLSAQTPDSVRTYQSTHLDSVKTWYSRVDTLIRVQTDTVVRADTTPKPLPNGVAVGPSHYPPSSFGTGPYNAGVLTVNASTLLSDLAAAKKGKARLVLAIPLSKTKDANGVSVAVAKAELARWPDLTPWVADRTVLAVYIGDDISDKVLNGSCAPCFVRYDSIAGAVKARWPTAKTVLRGKPTDLDSLNGKPFVWKHLDMGWAQYSHIPRDGEPLAYAQTQWASAKAQGFSCLIVGLNVIDGGDGSSGIPGGRVGRFEMSGAEVLKYGTIFARFTPAIIWWEYRTANHARIVNQVTQLRAMADTIPAPVCP